MKWPLVSIELKYQYTRTLSVRRIVFHDDCVECPRNYVPCGYIVFRHLIVTMVGNLDLSTTDKSANTLECRTHGGILTCGVAIGQGETNYRSPNSF